MKKLKSNLSSINNGFSTLLVCAGGGAGIVDGASHQSVWWGALAGALLGMGLGWLNYGRKKAYR